MSWLESDFVLQIIQNNLGPEILDLLMKVKERASKFENSPSAMTPSSPSPSPSVHSPSRTATSATKVVGGGIAVAAGNTTEDEDDEKIARKLVF